MIYQELHSLFQTGDRISNKELKALIQSLYDKYNIRATATASDINKFGFVTKPCKINKNGTKINGLILTEL